MKPDEYENFANYLTEVVKHFKEDWNIDFNYRSPVNERDIITYKVILKLNDKEEELQRFGNPFMTRVIIRSIGLHYEGRQD